MTGLEWVEQNFTKEKLLEIATTKLCTEIFGMRTEYDRNYCGEDDNENSCVDCTKCWNTKVVGKTKTAAEVLEERPLDELRDSVVGKVCPDTFGVTTELSEDCLDVDCTCEECWNSKALKVKPVNEV